MAPLSIGRNQRKPAMTIESDKKNLVAQLDALPQSHRFRNAVAALRVCLYALRDTVDHGEPTTTSEAEHEALDVLFRLCREIMEIQPTMQLNNKTVTAGLVMTRKTRAEMDAAVDRAFTEGAFDFPIVPAYVIINGAKVDADAAYDLLDSEIRDQLDRAQEWPSEQEFFDAYCCAHEAKFGQAFTGVAHVARPKR
jgi:hypothetical protein